jgi:hypothetical protein
MLKEALADHSIHLSLYADPAVIGAGEALA